MPIPPPRSPILDLHYSEDRGGINDTITREEMLELQREQETRLIGTFMVQSLFLGLAILLYTEWQWSQFSDPIYSALFYAIFGFSLQASMYYVYRTMFEDSASHRRKLKRTRNRHKKKMADYKYGIESQQLDMLMQQQMNQLQAQHALAGADGFIDNSEMQMLKAQYDALMNTAVQVDQQADRTVDFEQLARQLGVDRFRVGPIPLGPKLTVTQAPTTQMRVAQPAVAQQQAQSLDLTPKGTQDQPTEAQRQMA